MENQDLFYTLDTPIIPLPTVGLNSRYRSVLWKPSLRCLKPTGAPFIPFCIWWLMHFLHLFRNNNYSIFVIYEGDTLVHRSVVFPGFFRFPFMATDELQIGDTWTDPTHRQKGLAQHAIQEIVAAYQNSCRRFWYIVEENNLPSIRVVERFGFTKAGKGSKVKRFGLGLLGVYTMKDS